jgi:hypothetical protein
MAPVAEEDRPHAEEAEEYVAADGKAAAAAAAPASVPAASRAGVYGDDDGGGGGVQATLKGLSPPIKCTRLLPPAFLNLIQGQVKAPTLTNSIRMSTLGGGFRSFRGRTNN